MSVSQFLKDAAATGYAAIAPPWSGAEKGVMYPSWAFYVADRPISFYGHRLVDSRKSRLAIDVLLASNPTYNSPKRPLAEYLSPQGTVNPADLAGNTFDLVVVDRKASNYAYARSVIHREASATQTGTVKVIMIGDSLGDNCLAALYWTFTGLGAAMTTYGTRTFDAGGGVTVKHECRPGWSTADYIGKFRPAANPFLRTATGTDKTNTPALCFADDGSGRSYADNPNLTDYSIFDWTTWATTATVTLTDRIILILALGRNDATDVDWIDYQEDIVDQFKANFPNGSVIIPAETNGADVTGQSRWNVTRQIIQKKLELFDNLANADRGVFVAPAWAHMAADVGYPYTVQATSSYGVQTRLSTDDVHPSVGGLGYRQWAEAVVGPLAYLHETGYKSRTDLLAASKAMTGWTAVAAGTATLSAGAGPGGVDAYAIADAGSGSLRGMSKAVSGLTGSEVHEEWIFLKPSSGSPIACLNIQFTGGATTDFGVAVDLSTGEFMARSGVGTPDEIYCLADEDGYYKVGLRCTSPASSTAATVTLYPAWTNGTLAGTSTNAGVGTCLAWNPTMYAGDTI